MKVRCQNMNHGRSNAPIRFCPTCGDLVNGSVTGKCNEVKHLAARKERYIYCHDCGKKLATLLS